MISNIKQNYTPIEHVLMSTMSSKYWMTSFNRLMTSDVQRTLSLKSSERAAAASMHASTDSNSAERDLSLDLQVKLRTK